MRNVAVPTADHAATGGPARFPIGRIIVSAGIIVLVILAFLAYTIYYHPDQSLISNVPTVPVRVGSITATVNGSGQVAALSQARLAFHSSGTVASIPVKVGDAVKKGDTLIALDTTDLNLQVEQAQANVDSAQAKLEAIQAGARPEDVAAAQAVLDAAKAKLDGMLAGGRPADVKAAEAEVTSAQAKLDQVKQSIQPSDIAAAQAAVQQAQALLATDQANLANLLRPPDPLQIQNAELAINAAKASVYATQATRDGACGNAPRYACDANNAQVAAAETALQQAQVKLQLLQEGPKPEDVAAAKAAVTNATQQLAAAKAKLAQLQAGPLPQDVAQAQAALTAAQQQLELRKQPYTDADIAEQRQIVAQDEALLALKKAPYTQADLDQAKAALAQATAALDQAKHNLALATITAPFDGIISSVDTNVGETVSASPPTPVISLVDPNALEFDVPVDQQDEANVQVGQAATITFDALPGKIFTGKVVAIAPSAVIQSGVATYVVSISLDKAPGVKPGLTGEASIVYAHHDQVLVVPNRAVRSVGNGHVVDVLEGTKISPRTVTTGINDDQFTEIVSGLKLGDPVVIPLTSPILAPLTGPPGR
jgi:HlyD family secretion protein